MGYNPPKPPKADVSIVSGLRPNDPPLYEPLYQPMNVARLSRERREERTQFLLDAARAAYMDDRIDADEFEAAAAVAFDPKTTNGVFEATYHELTGAMPPRPLPAPPSRSKLAVCDVRQPPSVAAKRRLLPRRWAVQVLALLTTILCAALAFAFSGWATWALLYMTFVSAVMGVWSGRT